MKIKFLRMKNFRCFKDAEIKFNDRLTVVIGDNATGKTTVLEALATQANILLRYTREKPSPRFRNPEKNDSLLCIHADVDNRVISQVISAPNKKYRRIDEFFLSEQNGNELLKVAQEIEILVLEGNPVAIPLFRYFPLNRGIAYRHEERQDTQNSRLAVYDDALSNFWDYVKFLFWFKEKKLNELLTKEKIQTYTDITLDSIADAVEKCLDGYKDFRIEMFNNSMTMLLTSESGESTDVGHLSSGYASIIAIVADLAYRMAMGNPHMENPLESEAIVLIDEIDLSLHPKWQQRVLEDLPRVFPNAQFIVTTHSPLVLTTVSPENIVYLKRDGDDIAVHYGEEMEIGTKGADAMRIMSYFMEVSSRPPKFEEKIERYFELIDDGEHESEEAIDIRRELEKTLMGDPVLAGADDEIALKKEFA